MPNWGFKTLSNNYFSILHNQKIDFHGNNYDIKI